MHAGGYYGPIYNGPPTVRERIQIGVFQQNRQQSYIVAASPTVITSITVVTNVPPRATTLAVIDPGLARAASLQVTHDGASPPNVSSLYCSTKHSCSIPAELRGSCASSAHRRSCTCMREYE